TKQGAASGKRTASDHEDSKDGGFTGSQSHSDSDFSSTLNHGERDHSIQAHRGNDQRNRSEDTNNLHDEPALGHRPRQQSIKRCYAEDGLLRIDRTNLVCLAVASPALLDSARMTMLMNELGHCAFGT